MAVQGYLTDEVLEVVRAAVPVLCVDLLCVDLVLVRDTGKSRSASSSGRCRMPKCKSGATSVGGYVAARRYGQRCYATSTRR
jgi:hypothetical protein